MSGMSQVWHPFLCNSKRMIEVLDEAAVFSISYDSGR